MFAYAAAFKSYDRGRQKRRIGGSWECAQAMQGNAAPMSDAFVFDSEFPSSIWVFAMLARVSDRDARSSLWRKDLKAR
jgi:hypothetical protein